MTDYGTPSRRSIDRSLQFWLSRFFFFGCRDATKARFSRSSHNKWIAEKLMHLHGVAVRFLPAAGRLGCDRWVQRSIRTAGSIMIVADFRGTPAPRRLRRVLSVGNRITTATSPLPD